MPWGTDGVVVVVGDNVAGAWVRWQSDPLASERCHINADSLRLNGWFEGLPLIFPEARDPLKQPYVLTFKPQALPQPTSNPTLCPTPKKI